MPPLPQLHLRVPCNACPLLGSFLMELHIEVNFMVERGPCTEPESAQLAIYKTVGSSLENDGIGRVRWPSQETCISSSSFTGPVVRDVSCHIFEVSNVLRRNLKMPRQGCLSSVWGTLGAGSQSCALRRDGKNFPLSSNHTLPFSFLVFLAAMCLDNDRCRQHITY